VSDGTRTRDRLDHNQALDGGRVLSFDVHQTSTRLHKPDDPRKWAYELNLLVCSQNFG
jgi:hypothetical protein